MSLSWQWGCVPDHKYVAWQSNCWPNFAGFRISFGKPLCLTYRSRKRHSLRKTNFLSFDDNDEKLSLYVQWFVSRLSVWEVTDSIPNELPKPKHLLKANGALFSERFCGNAKNTTHLNRIETMEEKCLPLWWLRDML